MNCNVMYERRVTEKKSMDHCDPWITYVPLPVSMRMIWPQTKNMYVLYRCVLFSSGIKAAL